MRLKINVKVVERTTEHVSIEFTFYFSRFHNSRHQKTFLDTPRPLPVQVLWRRPRTIHRLRQILLPVRKLPAKSENKIWKILESSGEKPLFWHKNGVKSGISGLGETDDERHSCTSNRKLVSIEVTFYFSKFHKFKSQKPLFCQAHFQSRYSA